MNRPLEGVRIAVTRPAAQAEELARPLRAAGAAVILAPLIRVAPAPLAGVLREAVQHVGDYDWVVFSSVNGVELFLAAVRQAGDPAALQHTRVACVGPATAAAAQAGGLTVSAVPEEFVGDAIANALLRQGAVRGARILLARAGGARSVLPEQLAAQGARVDDVEVYRSILDDTGAQLLAAELRRHAVDVLTFTSASAVRNCAQHVGHVGDVQIAVIGPVTAEAVQAAGWTVTMAATPHTVEGLVAAVAEHFRSSREES